MNCLNKSLLLSFVLLFPFLISTKAKNAATSNPDWTHRSHGKSTPDYNVVFPQDSINRIDITLTVEQWKSVRENMKSLFGCDFGENTGGMGSTTQLEANYIPVQIRFKGKTWNNVGFRLKGNSSLSQAWREGIYKLPFRLNFSKFKEIDTTIVNQHFYGFEGLSFSPSFKDQSLVREKMASDIFRLAGVPAAQTAFYRVFIHFGAGSKYCGVYTAIELPDDNMVKSQFGSKKGSIYKPESTFSSFVESEFKKMNHKKEANYSDVQAFITALNSDLRTKNAIVWRTNLEAVFNVKLFIKYLAVNNTIVNWDSYGNMEHNYYLYHDSVKKLTWIPWDHNEALNGNPGITGSANRQDSRPKGMGPGMPGAPKRPEMPAGKQMPDAPKGMGEPGMPDGPEGMGGPGGQLGLSLSMNEVSKAWPLINYIVNDPTYMAQYKAELKEFNHGIFTQNAMDKLVDHYASIITPYVVGSEGEQIKCTYLTDSTSFQRALSDLKAHVSKRKSLLSSFIH